MQSWTTHTPLKTRSPNGAPLKTKRPIQNFDLPRDVDIPARLLVGEALAAVARKADLTNADVDVLKLAKNKNRASL